MPQLSLLAVQNTNLFSNHFLSERLIQDSAWSGLREEAREAFDRIKSIHEEARKLNLFKSTNEALAEEKYIVPVLDALGWRTLPQSSLRSGGKRRIPDQSLFLTAGEQQEASGALARSNPDFGAFARALTTLVEAKYWGRALDGHSQKLGDPDPTAQTINYLEALHTWNPRVEWAIVTNGAVWRILYHGADSRISDHYQVDLASIIESDDFDTFALYVYPFFGTAGFTAPLGTTRTRLELVLERSEEYAATVRDRIKDLVYTQIVGRLGDGFLRVWMRTQATKDGANAGSAAGIGHQASTELLDRIYDGSLTYLYRMLFILYAESRGLLPTHERGYARQSFDNIRQRAKDAVMNNEPVSSRTRDFARDLEDLRRLIDEGEPAFNLPQYNGGLFRRTVDDFPDGYEVSDDDLLMVIFLLTADATWDERGQQWITNGFYDYSSLTVRHLGDIYEGLLEFRLVVAEKPLASSRRDGRDVWRDATPEEIAEHEGHGLSAVALVRRAARPSGSTGYVQTGSVYVTNDKGERKAGGSYYTPHDIVEYNVAETVLPLLEERLARATEYFDAWIRGQGVVVQMPADPDQDFNDPVASANQLLADAAFETIFGLKVCDPAMGSGHFLVHTVNVVADRIAVYLADYNAERHAADPTHPGDPLTPRFGQMRREIVNGMARRGITLRPRDEEHLRDANLIRRLVLKRCIYGVDINRRAVELAKLSLWLHNFVVGAPLSFLDHHLKCGNSLVGARWSKVIAGIQGSLPIFAPDTSGIERATVKLIELNARLDATFDQVALSKEQSHEADTLMEPFKELLDIWTARAFDLSARSPNRSRFHLLLTGDMYRVEPKWGNRFLLDQAETFSDGHRIAREMQAFHWELEFPEVFFQQGEIADDAGFDAVVGNPPYVRQEQIAPVKTLLQIEFASYSGVADLYLYFYEQAILLCRPHGRVGYISSGTFARANFAAPFRIWLPTMADVVKVIDYGENQPFEGAEMVRPSIVILERLEEGSERRQAFQSLFLDEKIPSSLKEAMQRNGSVCDRSVLAAPEWKFQSAALTQLFDKVMSAGTPLGKMAGLQIFRGILTGLNEAFTITRDTRDTLISADPKSVDIIVPVLSGSDQRPWYQIDRDAYLIFTRRGVDIEQYPAVLEYLSQYRERLEPKPVGWKGKEWKGRKTGGYKWYEIQDSVDYYDEFLKPKILWPDISKLPRFSWDETGVRVNNTAYILTGSSPSMLAVLQSRVLWFAISQIATPLRLRAGLWQYRVINQFVERLPIPKVNKRTERRLAEIALQVTSLARERSTLSIRVLNRIVTDLGNGTSRPSDRLSHWEVLDFTEFRAELGKSFKKDVPLAERDTWDEYLSDNQREHLALKDQIVRLEMELNGIVYDLFDLTKDEQALIEKETKYSYGEM